MGESELVVAAGLCGGVLFIHLIQTCDNLVVCREGAGCVACLSVVVRAGRSEWLEEGAAIKVSHVYGSVLERIGELDATVVLDAQHTAIHGIGSQCG